MHTRDNICRYNNGRRGSLIHTGFASIDGSQGEDKYNSIKRIPSILIVFESNYNIVYLVLCL